VSSQTRRLDEPQRRSKVSEKSKIFRVISIETQNLTRRINIVLSFIAIVNTDFKLTGFTVFPITTVTQFNMKQSANRIRMNELKKFSLKFANELQTDDCTTAGRIIE